MKRLIFFCLLAASASLATAREQTPASDSRITYVGRTLVNGEEVYFDWSGVYARIRFTGGYLALTAGDSGRNYYNVWIDREPSADPDRIVVIDRDTTVVLFSSKIERKPRVHNLVIQKRTEGEQGRAVFRSFETDGSLLQAEGLRERVIEFIGDSYTCGYGSENSVREDPFRPEDENPAKTYADILCRYSEPTESACPIPARGSTATTTMQAADTRCPTVTCRRSTSRKSLPGISGDQNPTLPSSTWEPMISLPAVSRDTRNSGRDTCAS